MFKYICLEIIIFKNAASPSIILKLVRLTSGSTKSKNTELLMPWIF